MRAEVVQGQRGAVGRLAVVGSVVLGDAVGLERLVQPVPAQQLAAQVKVCVAGRRVVGDDVREEPHSVGVQARVARAQRTQHRLSTMSAAPVILARCASLWRSESAGKVTPGPRSKGPPFLAGRSGCKPGRALSQR